MPRINFDANGENGSLLLEPSRLNAVQFSEYFENWDFVSNVILNTNTTETTSPEGVYNATKMVENTVTNAHRVYDTISGGGNMLSFYAKAAERDWVNILVNNGTYIYLNVADGTKGTQQSGSPATIEDCGNGWYRCSVYNFHDTYAVIGVSQYNNVLSYTGDGTSGVYIFGAQVENSATYATSYIPNHGTSGGVTRAADSCSVTGVSDVLNDSEGVLYFEGNFSDIGSLYSAFTIGNSNNTSLVRFYRANSTTLNASVYEAGVWIWGYSLTTDTTQNFKVALRWSANVFNAFVNGVKLTGATDQNSFTLSQLSKVNMGNESMAFPFHGNVKELVVLNEALSDSELATLTTL